MPIKRDSFFRQRSDKYMEGMESIVFFLYSNKEKAFTSSEISYETDIMDKELVLRILRDLKRDGKVNERLIFDGKRSDFYYIIDKEAIEKEQKAKEEEKNDGNDDSTQTDQQ